MVVKNLDELLALDVARRLDLIARLWDSVVDDSHHFPVTEGEKQLLAQRLKEDDEDPDAAIPWEDIRDDFLSYR